MGFLNSSFFKKYLLPGFVFQSVVIAGGYGTGRELIEYFLNFGPVGGLLGMFCITTVIWSLLLAVTFEFSRIFKAYDYRTLFKHLLGPFWFLFEIPYFIFLFILMGVIGSAAGILLHDNFGIPYFGGVAVMMLAIGFFTFKGSRVIEQFLSGWSIVLYVVYAVFLVTALVKFGPLIRDHFALGEIKAGWALGGFKYALYNLGVIPAVYFCLNHVKTRREAITSGLLAGVIGIIPAFLFYVAVVGFYDGILAEEVPAVFALQQSGIPLLLILFQIVLFGTLIETGTGLIHSVNQRIQSTLQARGRELKRWHRPLIAALFLLCGLGISSFGLVTLIDKGYGTVSWGFLFVYFIPIFTLGLYRIIKHKGS